MAINVFLKPEAGNGLEFTDAKYQVKAGTNIKVDADGVHAVIPESKVAVSDITSDEANNKLTLTKTDGSTSDVALPKQTVDVKLSGLTFDGGKLTGTLSDGTEVSTDFTAEVVVAAIEAADDAQKERIAAALGSAFLKALKGDEVQDSSNTTLGYLLAK